MLAALKMAYFLILRLGVLTLANLNFGVFEIGQIGVHSEVH
jgi:hypothetical protein